MYTRKFWNILIVDDDEDIRRISKIALRGVTVFGSPLKLHFAESKAAAIELLGMDGTNKQSLVTHIAVALVDVVMESDEAGLELCEQIRSGNGTPNRRMQLVLRTGQPGKAPPRTIIDKYEITSYMAKAEATPDRLVLAIQAGIQNYAYLSELQITAMKGTFLREAVNDGDFVNKCKELVNWDFGEQSGMELNAALDFGHSYVGAGSFKEQSVWNEMKASLLDKASAQLESHMFWGNKNPWAMVDDYLVLRIQPGNSEVPQYLCLKEPNCPRGNYDLHAAIWANEFAAMCQEMNTANAK